MDLWKKNRRVYGARKLYKAARRAGIEVGRDQVATVMKKAGISGVKRGKKRKTTWPDETAERPADLVDRKFLAPAPNRLWVADITYVPTWSGFAYTAFVTDAFSRAIVGWKVSSSLSADLALDALEMAIWRRKGDLSKLIHHSDRGVQYLAIRYSERLADIEAAASVGSKGDSFDCPSGVDQRALQDRVCRHRRALQDGRSGRARHSVVGGVVQRRAPPQLLRGRSTGRVRSGLLRCQGRD